MLLQQVIHGLAMTKKPHEALQLFKEIERGQVWRRQARLQRATIPRPMLALDAIEGVTGVPSWIYGAK
jgi:pentatricopeptide repeat protein